MKITIGSEIETGKAFALPADLVTSTLVVYGGKGMGKTNLGAVVAEELTAAGLRWAALDPMGVWWGMRHSRDGEGPGIECLILGGPHGDIPIEPTGGAVVADLVADEDVNVIIDFSRKPSGETWGVGEKIRFVTDYGRRLFARQGSLINGKRREPLFQVMDEAARFIPQMIRAGQPELAMCLSVWAQFVEEGRNNGLGIGLLTQRSARLNKDVAELADAMIAFRTIGPNSIEAVTDWLGEHVPRERIKTAIETVRELPRGRALVVSPGWLQFEGMVQVRLRHTFDSSATPKPGESTRRVTGVAAKPDLANYAARMQESIERAKESDPVLLKKRIAELQRELAQKQGKQPEKKAIADPGLIHNAVAKALKARDRQWHKELEDFASQLARESREFAASLAARLTSGVIARVGDHTNIGPALNAVSNSPGTAGTLTLRKGGHGESSPEPRGAGAVSVPRIMTQNVTRTVAHANGNLGAVEQKIINALAEMEVLGMDAPPKQQLAMLSGYGNARSGGFSEPLGSLHTVGMVNYPQPGKVSLTPDGRTAAQPRSAPLDSVELQERLLALLNGSEAKILRELISLYPRAISKEDLARSCNYGNPRSGGFSEPLGRLRAMGIAEYPIPGQAKLSPWVMLE